METETGAAKVIRGLVKTVFIACYIAFMWASIHHVATFFNNFEENNGNTFGSYLLAGAFDITALVTTIGVMFFRKSMPAWVFWIVWAFILTIAGYSFFINWEYTSHYQNMSLIMQPTGQTVPVYDAHKTLHYVPVMKVNTSLLYVNPIIASGFTIFSLIYSVVAEFFGTKAPTIEQLLAKEKYLKETGNVLESIRQLEEKPRGKSLIATLKDRVIEGKEAWKEVISSGENNQLPQENAEGNVEESARNLQKSPEESGIILLRKTEGKREKMVEEFGEEKYPSWLSTGGSTVPISTVVSHTKITKTVLKNRVESKKIKATKNKDIIYKASLIEWMKTEGIYEEMVNKIPESLEVNS